MYIASLLLLLNIYLVALCKTYKGLAVQWSCTGGFNYLFLHLGGRVEVKHGAALSESLASLYPHPLYALQFSLPSGSPCFALRQQPATWLGLEVSAVSDPFQGFLLFRSFSHLSPNKLCKYVSHFLETPSYPANYFQLSFLIADNGLLNYYS